MASSGIITWLFSSPPNPNYVTNTNDDGVGSLRWAITNAQSDSEITFDPSIKGDTTILVSGYIHIRQHNLTIQGSGGSFSNTISGYGGIIIDASASISIIGLAFSNLYSSSPLVNYGKLVLSNCIISQNISDTTQGGGITFFYSFAAASLPFCTIDSNTASEGRGSGIFLDHTKPEFVHMKTSIVAGDDTHTHSAIAGGMITSDGYNLVQNMSSTDFVPNSMHTTDQAVNNMLHVFSLDHSLQRKYWLNAAYILSISTDNPAVNAIPLSVCADKQGQPIYTDQLGMPRPGRNKHGKLACDIGAYESSN